MNETIKSQNYVLLVDETGIDNSSSKIYYVGCLMELETLAKAERLIREFNAKALEDPARSNKKSWVNSIDESRHYAEDHFTLREEFMWSVLPQIHCRVYVVSIDYCKDDVSSLKSIAFAELIRIAKSTRRAHAVQCIAEHGERAFEKSFPTVIFRDKTFLPLSIPDYYAGAIKAFHELRQQLSMGERLEKDKSSIDYRFYELMGSSIAFEYDISTGQSSSRRSRVHLDKVKKLI